MPSSTRDLQFYDLSHPWGHGAPSWPYFPDIEIKRFHYHAKSGVLSQQTTTFMYSTQSGMPHRSTRSMLSWTLAIEAKERDRSNKQGLSSKGGTNHETITCIFRR